MEKIKSLITSAQAGQDNSEMFVELGVELAKLNGKDLANSVKYVVELAGDKQSPFYHRDTVVTPTTGSLTTLQRRVQENREYSDSYKHGVACMTMDAKQMVSEGLKLAGGSPDQMSIAIDILSGHELIYAPTKKPGGMNQ